LLFKFPSLYPGNGPLIRFVRPPYHACVSEHGRIQLPEVQEYYDDSLHVFELVEEIKLMLQRENAPGAGAAIDDTHGKAWANRDQYRQLVGEWIRKNGVANPMDYTRGWEIVLMPDDRRAEVTGTEAAPRQYLCPLTKKPMKAPVLSPTTGYYYEKSALDALLNEDGAECPMTGKKFTDRDRDLPIDRAMSQRIVIFFANNG
jgi:hypothetical protein